jgi:hypothetical protein
MEVNRFYEEVTYIDTFREGALSDKQRRFAEQVVARAKKWLPDLSSTTVLGYDPTEKLVKLKSFMKARSKLVNRAAKTELRHAKKFRDRRVKILFDCSGIDVSRSYSIVRTRTWVEHELVRDTWTGLFDFDLPRRITFGRGSNLTEHGGGKYCFAPYVLSLPHLREQHAQHLKESPALLDEVSHAMREELRDRIPPLEIAVDAIVRHLRKILVTIQELDTFEDDEQADEVLKDLPRKPETIFGLDFLRRGPVPARHLWTAFRQRMGKTRTGIALVDALNRNTQLIQEMEDSIIHFANLKVGENKLAISSVDVSTICQPIRDKMLFHIVDYAGPETRVPKAIYVLALALKDLSEARIYELSDITAKQWLEACETERIKYHEMLARVKKLTANL